MLFCVCLHAYCSQEGSSAVTCNMPGERLLTRGRREPKARRSVQCLLRVVCCTLSVARCVLPLHVACWHVACCQSHGGCCNMPGTGLECGATLPARNGDRRHATTTCNASGKHDPTDNGRHARHWQVVDYIFGHTSSLASCACEARIDPQAAHGHIFEFISDHAALSAQVSANTHAQRFRRTPMRKHLQAVWRPQRTDMRMSSRAGSPARSWRTQWPIRCPAERRAGYAGSAVRALRPHGRRRSSLRAPRQDGGMVPTSLPPASFFELPSWAGQARAEQRTVVVAA